MTDTEQQQFDAAAQIIASHVPSTEKGKLSIQVCEMPEQDGAHMLYVTRLMPVSGDPLEYDDWSDYYCDLENTLAAATATANSAVAKGLLCELKYVPFTGYSETLEF